MDKKTFHLPSLRQNKTPNNMTTATTAMNAVAFQDHWVRTLSLGVPGPRQVGLGPAARAAKKKPVRALVDTGLHKPKPKLLPPPDQEYVLDEKPPPLTLAQKLGLIDAPEQLLSETEWANLKAKSNSRDDSKEPCVICKDDFGLQEQVILSCSHVFHRACLHAFERYTGRKTCPMCRREQYQTRVIHEGAKQHRQHSATRIQAAWRGYVVRCWYKKLRQTQPPKDPNLRKKFYLEKFHEITDRIIRSCDFDINTFLTEIDVSLEQSRNIFRQFDNVHRIISDEEWDMIQLKAVERSHQECPICLNNLCSTTPDDSPEKPDTTTTTTTGAKTPKTQASRSHLTVKSTKPKFAPPPKGAKVFAGGEKSKGENSDKGANSVSGDGVEDVGGGGDGVGVSDGGGGGGISSRRRKKTQKRTVLLSCTHVFHETCLLTLEELAMGEVKSTCPVCRTPYQKRVITM